MAVGQFKSYTWDPLLIISQIIAVQAIFYISFGMLLYGLNFAVNKDISLLQIFDVTVSVASCLNFVGNIYGSCFFGNKAKRWISKRVSQENKIHLIFWEANISYLDTYYVSRGKKCLFFKNVGVLCFLVTLVLRLALLLYYRRFL